MTQTTSPSDLVLIGSPSSKWPAGRSPNSPPFAAVMTSHSKPLAVVFLQLALVVGVLSFDVEGELVVLFLIVVVLWIAATSSSRIARAIGAGLLVGMVLVGLSFLAPRGSATSYIALVVDAAIGVVAWIAFPRLLVGGWSEN